MTTSKHPVIFKNRYGSPLAHDADLNVMPLTWSGSDLGGPKEAIIKLEGPRATLKNVLTSWLRYEVIIHTDKGTPCWWGYVHEVTLEIDGLAITSSLDNLRNRVAVTYSSLEGTVEQGITSAWSQDAASIASYGIKEHFESLGSASVAMANSIQSLMLSQYARPKLKRSIGSPGKVVATLKCYGWIETTSWLYFQRTTGRIEHMLGSSKPQPIGWGITNSNQIGFGGYGIHDAAGRLSVLSPYMDIGVSGSSLNNTLYPTSDTSTDGVDVFTATTIRFEPSDDMFEQWGNMTMLKSDQWVKVEGSAANSRWHWIGSAGAEHTRFSSAISGAVSGEAAGPSITLTQAQKIPCNIKGAWEAPGTSSTVTLVLHGHVIAQKFYCTTAMTVDRVFLEVAKYGAPSDSLRVSLYTDSGGNVGSFLRSGTLAAANMTEEATGAWISFTSYGLSSGTYYWIMVDRTGALDGSNHYIVSMTEEVSETCRGWNGSGWLTHRPGWYLKYRLWAVADTGAMVEEMLDYRPQFLDVSTGYTSGVNGYSTMDQIMVVKDEMLRLLSMGNSAGGRIQILVSPDKTVKLKNAPTTPSAFDTLHLSTRNEVLLTDSVGTEWPKGLLPYGLYVTLIDLDADLQVEQGLSPALITEVEYDAEEESWNISFGGERSLSDILKVQQG